MSSLYVITISINYFGHFLHNIGMDDCHTCAGSIGVCLGTLYTPGFVSELMAHLQPNTFLKLRRLPTPAVLCKGRSMVHPNGKTIDS